MIVSKVDVPTKITPEIIEDVSFNKLLPHQKELIKFWLATDHVRSVWSDGGVTVNDMELFFQGKSIFQHWIGYYKTLPFCYIMTKEESYNSNDSFSKWLNPAKKTRGLDFLIGDERFLNKGIAYLILKKFIIAHCSDIDIISIDPDIDNSKAIHIYKKIGFKPIGIHTTEKGAFQGTQQLILQSNYSDLIAKKY